MDLITLAMMPTGAMRRKKTPIRFCGAVNQHSSLKSNTTKSFPDSTTFGPSNCDLKTEDSGAGEGGSVVKSTFVCGSQKPVPPAPGEFSRPLPASLGTHRHVCVPTQNYNNNDDDVNIKHYYYYCKGIFG